MTATSTSLSASAAPLSQRLATRYYDFGATTVYAHAADPRFAYTLYVPPSIADATRAIDLVVVVHGTGRQFVDYRNAFAEFGRWHDCVILCPLFPAGVLGDGNRDGFKHLIEGDIRYDQVLLDMVAAVGQRYERDFDQFALFGYSGGGQFVNRFAYLHPEHLWAATIGAPGSVTLLEDDRDWWVGVRGMQERFGKALDVEALRRVPLQLVVGKFDTDTWEITHTEASRHYMPGANDAGATRRERIETLRQSLLQRGVQARLDVVDNVSHAGLQCVRHVQDFFHETLLALRARRPAMAAAASTVA
ncbi:alpha/beta hydrolase [Hydrogenophaga sp. 2FB]|uniref:alpha/beta hydrolase n=1 Tax=Hydrogenophaga sp. 2FB TaxID=2502187 RepID=UPI0010F67CEA|nr:alpha/beta hydrolase [Hydrogenophaga sp. 2FB]